MILDRLVADGKVPGDRYEEIVIHAERVGVPIEEVLLQLGMMNEGELLKYLAAIYQTRFVSTDKLSKAAVDPALIRAVPRKLAERLVAFPILFNPTTRVLSVVAADLTESDISKQMQFATNARDVRVYVAREAAIRAAIEKYYDGQKRAFELLNQADAAAAKQHRKRATTTEEWSLVGRVFEEEGDQLILRGGRNPKGGFGTGTNLPAPDADYGDAPPPAQSIVPPVQEMAISPDAFLETLKLLVTMLEQPHADLRGHSARVARLSQQLGRRMRLPLPNVQGILVAAYLHDLGQPAQSHHTPLSAALSEAHLGAAKRGFLAPVQLMESVGLPEIALSTLKHRYERFDGAGFPDRLARKDIPLGARILAVAECYVSLTHGDQNIRGEKLAAADAWAVLAEHKGTIFDPTVVDWLRQEVLSEDAQDKLLSDRYRVLLVDPDPEDTAVLEVHLTEQGYDVTVVRDAAEAMQRLDNQPVDIVISEIVLPGDDGLAFLKKLRDGTHREIPVMFLTAKGDHKSSSLGLEGGAADYVIKPAAAAVVGAKARRIIEEDRGVATAGRGVSGKLTEMALPDVVQILSGGRKSGRLAIRSGAISGEMIFLQGAIHDAKFGEHEGAEAVYAMLGLTDGDFSLNPDVPDIENRIGLTTETLLLETMRRLDEASR